MKHLLVGNRIAVFVLILITFWSLTPAWPKQDDEESKTGSANHRRSIAR